MGEVAILNRVIKTVKIGKVTFEEKPEGRGVIHVDNWGEELQAERRPSTKALRWKMNSGSRREATVAGMEGARGRGAR